MRAVFIHAPFDVRLGDLPTPNAAPGLVLVDIEAVGLCGSDLHYYKEGAIGAAQTITVPFVPGHEVAGRVRDALPERQIAAGARVVIDPARPCGACEWCHRALHNLCPHTLMLGAPPNHGGMTATVAVAAEQLFAVPEDFSASTTALLEPFGVCIHSIDLARPQWFETVAVLGAGPIGLGILQLLRVAGINEPLVVEPVAYRRDAALRLGAGAVFDTVEALVAATRGRGADLVLEATNSPAGFADAAEASVIGGRLVVVGIPDGNAYTFEAAVARRKQLQVVFSRRMGDVLPRAIRLAAEGRIDLEAWVSHRVGLDAVPEAFSMLAGYRDGALKVVVEPARSSVDAERA
jgi:L-iditol 2-dehydrogenase